jgi:hypothetical protein
MQPFTPSALISAGCRFLLSRPRPRQTGRSADSYRKSPLTVE